MQVNRNLQRAIAAVLRKSLLYSSLLLFADSLGIAVASIALGRSLFHHYTLLTLLEAAFLFLFGGAIDLGGSISYRRISDRINKTQKAWDFNEHRQTQTKAAPYIITGTILLILSFVLAYPLG